MHYIYKITNKKTNKKYIGQTENPDRRQEQHFSESHNSKLKKDVASLGKDQFEFEIMDEIEDPILCNFMEISAIEEAAKNPIYNMVPGGQLTSSFDRYICDNCGSIKEMRCMDFGSKNIGMIFFSVELGTIDKAILLCHECRIDIDGTPHPIARNYKKYPRSLNLTSNTFMDMAISYDWQDSVFNKLIMVDGKMNARMAYGFFAKRLGYK